MVEQEQKTSKTNDSRSKQIAAASLLFELGIEFAFIIALPLIALIFAGKWLDMRTHHHFFVIIGILLALGLSSYLMYKKIIQAKNLLK